MYKYLKCLWWEWRITRQINKNKAYWRAHPLSKERRDEINKRVDFKIIQALASAYYTARSNCLIDLSVYSLHVSAIHEVIRQDNLDFYNININAMKSIGNLAESIHSDILTLIPLQENKCEENISDHHLVKSMHSSANELHKRYLEILPSMLDDDCVSVLVNHERSYYLKVLIPLHEKKLLEAS